MTTPEQQAREMLGRMGFTAADFFSAGDLVELAEMLVQIEAAKDLLAMLHGDGGHYVLEHGFVKACADAVTKKFSLITENTALKAELAAIKGAGEPVAWSITMDGHHTRNVLDDEQKAIDLMNRLNHNFPGDVRAVVPLYTRPCVPLTDEKVKELICEHFVTGENLFNEVHQDYRFRSPATERNVWGRDLLKFARAIEAHIKGAKG